MNKIIILTTPFHLQQIIKLKDVLGLDKSNVHVLFSNYVNGDEISNNLGGHVTLHPFKSSGLQLLNTHYFKRMVDLLLHPLESFMAYRNVVLANFDFLNPIFQSIDFSKSTELVICNDRDFLAQISIELLERKINNFSITAVDEGTGFYVKENLKHKLMKLLYKVISKPLLGFQYRYMEQYGTHPKISTVYIRYPDLLPYRCKHINYVTMAEQNITDKHIIHFNRPAILLFSTLLSEEGFVSESGEMDFYRSFSAHLTERGYGLVIKHHPREKTEKLAKIGEILAENKSLEFKIIDKEVQGEQIDVSKFDWVVNFGSSVILNILSSGFQPQKIITLKLKKMAFPNHLFSSTLILPFKNFINLLDSSSPFVK